MDRVIAYATSGDPDLLGRPFFPHQQISREILIEPSSALHVCLLWNPRRREVSATHEEKDVLARSIPPKGDWCACNGGPLAVLVT